MFKVSFHHQNLNSPSKILSGNPGYEFGKPLLYGKINEINNQTKLIKEKILIWKTSPNSKCDYLSRQEIKFGINSISSCIFDVPDKNENCTEINDKIL